jgi:homoserine O-acetyltransferase
VKGAGRPLFAVIANPSEAEWAPKDSLQRRLLQPRPGRGHPRLRLDLRRLGRVSEAFFRTKAYRMFDADSHEAFAQNFWEPFFLKCDANNLLSQLSTWFDGDISANPTYKGDFEAALRAIRARTIILPVDTDRYFPPVDAQEEAQHIPNAECRVIESIWGHMAPMNPGDIPVIDAALRELLE